MSEDDVLFGYRLRVLDYASPVIRVLVVDDEPLVRRGIQMILGAQPDIEVAGWAADGREALRQARALRPDVVLMDGPRAGGPGRSSRPRG